MYRGRTVQEQQPAPNKKLYASGQWPTVANGDIQSIWLNTFRLKWRLLPKLLSPGRNSANTHSIFSPFHEQDICWLKEYVLPIEMESALLLTCI